MLDPRPCRNPGVGLECLAGLRAPAAVAVAAAASLGLVDLAVLAAAVFIRAFVVLTVLVPICFSRVVEVHVVVAVDAHLVSRGGQPEGVLIFAVMSIDGMYILKQRCCISGAL